MGNSAREIVLETYSVLPLTALGHTVIMVDGKVGTLRICGRVWSLKAKYLVFFTLKNKKQKKMKKKHQEVKLLSRQHIGDLPGKDPQT